MPAVPELRRLAERGLPVHVLVLTASGERADVLEAVRREQPDIW